MIGKCQGKTEIPLPAAERSPKHVNVSGGSCELPSILLQRPTQRQRGQTSSLENLTGGEGGIRTPDRGVSPYNGLANRRLQPLGHLSGGLRLWLLYQPCVRLRRAVWLEVAVVTGQGTRPNRRMDWRQPAGDGPSGGSISALFAPPAEAARLCPSGRSPGNISWSAH
jgi:hypothetical protein